MARCSTLLKFEKLTKLNGLVHGSFTTVRYLLLGGHSCWRVSAMNTRTTLAIITRHRKVKSIDFTFLWRVIGNSTNERTSYFGPVHPDCRVQLYSNTTLEYTVHTGNTWQEDWNRAERTLGSI